MTWIERHNAAFAVCEAARDALNKAVFGSEGPEAREAAQKRLQAAEDAFNKVQFDAAQDYFYLLRNAKKFHPEQVITQHEDILADSIAEAVEASQEDS